MDGWVGRWMDVFTWKSKSIISARLRGRGVAAHSRRCRVKRESGLVWWWVGGWVGEVGSMVGGWVGGRYLRKKLWVRL